LPESRLLLKAALTLLAASQAIAVASAISGRREPGFTAVTMSIAAASMIHAACTLRWRAPIAVALASLIGFTVEVIGVRTGFPFGRYVYNLSPMVLGVSAIIPLYWFVATYASYWVAYATLRSRELLLSAYTGACAALWDLVMDPVMSNLVEAWTWLDRGPLGIPLTNYIGWLLTSMLIAEVYRRLGLRAREKLTEATGVLTYLALLSSVAVASAALGKPSYILLGLGALAASALASARLIKA